MADSMIRSLRMYLENSLHVHSSITPWKEARRLPLFLNEGFKYYKLLLTLGASRVGMLICHDLNEDERFPRQVAKFMESIRKHADEEVVYSAESLSSYKKNRLVQLGVPFVVPEKLMYLPMLGVFFSERVNARRIIPTHLPPATQVLLLYALLKGDEVPLEPRKLAGTLGYSTMTMTRAFNQIEAAGLAEYKKSGKSRKLSLLFHGKELWQEAQRLLSSPVLKRFYVEPFQSMKGMPVAGESAVSILSSLAEPKSMTFATTSAHWETVAGGDAILEQHPHFFPGLVEIELWRYPPEALSSQGTVDPLSLYLSLRHEEDERLEAALEEIIRAVEW